MTLPVRSVRIALLDLELEADIGFHAFEIGAPQRLLVSVEVWVEAGRLPTADRPEEAWDYDFIRTRVLALAASRRFNLQETLARAIWEVVTSRPDVTAAAVTVRKPDIYPDCDSVGVTLSSAAPPGA